MVVGEDEDVNAVTEFINKYVGSDYTEGSKKHVKSCIGPNI